MAKAKNKKKSVSPKVAFILSSAFLVICVVMLFFSVSLTKQSPEVAESESIQSVSTIQTESQEVSEKQEAVKAKEDLQKKKESVKKKDSGKIEKTKSDAVRESLSNINPPAEKKAKYKIYIILDDGGHNLTHLKPFMSLKFPFAVAVLPLLPHTNDVAKEVVSGGKCLMLHQPMQAINRSVNPGPGAIEPEFDQVKIRQILEENIAELNSLEGGNGKLVGMNNHEGSLITENPEIMKIVLEICKEKGIFFLDSRTNSNSVCRKVADEVGMQIYERNIFLDNTPDKENMIKEFRRGAEIARKNGSVIMIGHVWSAENLADVLEKMYSEYSTQGFEFVSF